MHFDKITDRTNCRSLKWDAMERAFGRHRAEVKTLAHE